MNQPPNWRGELNEINQSKPRFDAYAWLGIIPSRTLGDGTFARGQRFRFLVYHASIDRVRSNRDEGLGLPCFSARPAFSPAAPPYVSSDTSPQRGRSKSGLAPLAYAEPLLELAVVGRRHSGLYLSVYRTVGISRSPLPKLISQARPRKITMSACSPTAGHKRGPTHCLPIPRYAR